MFPYAFTLCFPPERASPCEVRLREMRTFGGPQPREPCWEIDRWPSVAEIGTESEDAVAAILHFRPLRRVKWQGILPERCRPVALFLLGPMINSADGLLCHISKF